MRRQKRLTSFTAGYSQIQVIVPFLAASPAYFARAIELGGLMQTASAFGRVQGALSFFVNAYPQLAEWRAVIERLDGFDQSIASATVEQPKMLVTSPTKDHAICITGLVLSKPDGSALLNVGAIHLAAGETTLVIGPSGGGKSTFLRAVAGIWPHCDGQIAIPAGTRLLILPQRPYLPDGQLRDAITYPLHRNASDDRQISDLLYDVGLGRLAERLADTSHWQIQLSLGEQQRLSIVRAILQEPDWLFLDEATASLDEGSERHVYQLLAQRLPDATIVSVGHRSTLRALHKRTIDLGQIAIESSTRVVLRGRQVQVSVESEIDAGRLGPGQPGSIVSDPDHGQQHGYEASSQRVA